VVAGRKHSEKKRQGLKNRIRIQLMTDSMCPEPVLKKKEGKKKERTKCQLKEMKRKEERRTKCSYNYFFSPSLFVVVRLPSFLFWKPQSVHSLSNLDPFTDWTELIHPRLPSFFTINHCFDTPTYSPTYLQAPSHTEPNNFLFTVITPLPSPLPGNPCHYHTATKKSIPQRDQEWQYSHIGRRERERERGRERDKNESKGSERFSAIRIVCLWAEVEKWWSVGGIRDWQVLFCWTWQTDRLANWLTGVEWVRHPGYHGECQCRRQFQ